MASKKALVIGTNYVGVPHKRLHGCYNDVLNTLKYLQNNFDVQEDNIMVMTDCSDQSLQPTGQNIKNALLSLRQSSKPGDVIFIYFAGHCEDHNGELSLVGCDLDFVPGHYLRSVAKDISRICMLTVMTDTCHARGLFKNYFKTNPVSRFLKFLRGTLCGAGDPSTGTILFAACQEKEYAREYNGCGVFSYYVAEVIAESHGRITNRELIKMVKPRVLQIYPMQHAEMECTDGLANLQFLAQIMLAKGTHV